jgi:G3E family GTPase
MASHPMATTALPFTVIGGYLGAGKTTLLNRMLAQAGGLRLAVLVNDFGDLNIDAALVRRHAGDTIELANGCLCCSLVSGFAEALSQVKSRAADFDQVVIEASGVAEPVRVAEMAQGFGLPVDGMLVVVDAEQIDRQAADRYVGDVVRRQLRQGDLLLVNKLDRITADQHAGLHERLEALAPGVPRLEMVRGEVPLELLLGLHRGRGLPSSLSDDLPGAEAAQRHGDRFDTWTLRSDQPLSRLQLERFAAGLGPGIYRAKGFVALAEDPGRRQLFQQVGQRWSLEPAETWSNDTTASSLVVIGRRGATSSGALQELLESGQALIDPPAGAGLHRG